MFVNDTAMVVSTSLPFEIPFIAFLLEEEDMSKQVWPYTCDYVLCMAVHSIGQVSNNNECVYRTNMVRALSCYRSTRAAKGIHSIFRTIHNKC